MRYWGCKLRETAHLTLVGSNIEVASSGRVRTTDFLKRIEISGLASFCYAQMLG